MNAHLVNHNGVLHISGDLNFLSVPMLWKEMIPLLSPNSTFKIDFINVTSVNSAAVALLVELKKWSQKENIKFDFQNIPQQILAIAEVAGLAIYF